MPGLARPVLFGVRMESGNIISILVLGFLVLASFPLLSLRLIRVNASDARTPSRRQNPRLVYPSSCFF
jgi:hypothetical protein